MPQSSEINVNHIAIIAWPELTMEKIIKLRLYFRLPDFSFCTCSSTPLVEEECHPDSIFVDLVVQCKHLWAATNSLCLVCPALGGTRYTEIGWNTRAHTWSLSCGSFLPGMRHFDWSCCGWHGSVGNGAGGIPRSQS